MKRALQMRNARIRAVDLFGNKKSLDREAFCRHALIAEMYLRAAQSKNWLEILSHDIDVEGVDLTLIRDGAMIPLQLKSRVLGSTTGGWDVKRRIVLPPLHSFVHKGMFDVTDPDPATEGLGGALVCQEIGPLKAWPNARIW